MDKNPELAAQYHCDAHVRKMIIESAQMLSTAHRVLDGRLYYEKSSNNRNLKRWALDDEREEILYKAAYFNHPCTLWVMKGDCNYGWLYSLFAYLCDEYAFRFNKRHATDTRLKIDLAFHPNKIDKIKDKTELPLAMPDYCKLENPLSSYRNYYKEEKSHLFKWTKRDVPFWIK